MKNQMYKPLLIAIFAIFSVAGGQAQKVKGNGNLVDKNRSVGSFEGIAVAGSFDVILVKGDEGRIDLQVEENLEPYLETEVEGQTLKVRWKRGANIRTTKNTTVTVHFKELNEVALSGSGDVRSKSLLQDDAMTVALAGSGDIDLELAASSVESAISGSGDIRLHGKASALHAAVSGSGDTDASELQCEKADLAISGSGNMRVHVSQELKARISGSGNIKYKGNPAREDVKVSGSGSVITY